MRLLLLLQGLRLGAGQTPVQAYWKELLQYIQVRFPILAHGRSWRL